jgi:uncharacterized protein YndB with AHSA1/START domain
MKDSESNANNEDETISLERIYTAPINAVWAAVTEKEQLRKWYFDFSESFKLEPDHEWEWWAGPPGGKQWLHRGKITDVVAGKKLAHTWEYPGYQGKALVEWELVELDKNSTRLNFEFKILIPFDQNEEALKRKNFVEGWNYIVHTGLKEFLEKPFNK